MLREDIRHLPVVAEDGYLVGLITLSALNMAVFQEPHRASRPPVFADATVRDLMDLVPPTCRPSDVLRDVIERMLTERLTCMLVLNHDDVLIGMLTRTDIIHALRSSVLSAEEAGASL